MSRPSARPNGNRTPGVWRVRGIALIWALLATAAVANGVAHFAAERKADEANLRFAADARRTAAAAAGARGRVISLRVQTVGLKTACGWVDTGGPDGIVPIYVDGGVPGVSTIHASITPIVGRPLAGRVEGAFNRELTIILCGDDLPPPTAGVVQDPAIYGPLKDLWASPSATWAIIPALG